MKKSICCLFLLLGFGVFLAAQDPDIEAREREVEEEIFRTSQQINQTPTSRRGREAKNKRQTVPEGAFRIGCTCMDDSPSKSRSTGACSGRNGVRYWHYRTKDGDTVRVLTARHEQHPYPLTEAERSAIAQKNVVKVKQMLAANPIAQQMLPAPAPIVVMQPTNPIGMEQQDHALWFSWSDVAGLVVIGISLYTTIRLVLRWLDRNPNLFRYALRHFVRPRKRSLARKVRKTPPAAGL